ncbi:MAG TPA: GntR family transcriptional regulator [Sphaerochaeta sp.]|nr:GntR family transcriptional regulator [Sphaerochaeta sp.]
MEDIFAVTSSRPSAVDGVIEKIKELLMERKLSPGDMIPNETSLAESLKVGRGTIREALKILSAYGVVEIKQGHGTFISSASNKRLFNPQLFQILVQDRDYTSLTQVRELLEEGIVKLVIGSASDEELAQLEEAMEAFLTELKKERISSSSAGECDLRYHMMLAKFSHNSIVENIYTFVLELFAKTINPVHKGVTDVHRRLQMAIMARDVDAAVLAIRDHTQIWISGYKAQNSLK